jgi:mitochondrial-processing peptidase subunit alpha
VEHQDLLDFSEHLLTDWHKGSPVEKPKSTYIGGDFRHKEESDVSILLVVTCLIYAFPSVLL